VRALDALKEPYVGWMGSKRTHHLFHRPLRGIPVWKEYQIRTPCGQRGHFMGMLRRQGDAALEIQSIECIHEHQPRVFVCQPQVVLGQCRDDPLHACQR